MEKGTYAPSSNGKKELDKEKFWTESVSECYKKLIEGELPSFFESGGKR